MLNSCSDPLVCTQETAAHLKRFRASQLRCAPGYRHNDITVLIIGNPNSPVNLANHRSIWLTTANHKSIWFCGFLTPRWHLAMTNARWQMAGPEQFGKKVSPKIQTRSLGDWLLRKAAFAYRPRVWTVHKMRVRQVAERTRTPRVFRYT